MADPKKKALSRLLVEEIVGYGSALLLAGGIFLHQSGWLSDVFDTKAKPEQPAVTEVQKPAVTVQVEPRAKDDVVVPAQPEDLTKPAEEEPTPIIKAEPETKPEEHTAIIPTVEGPGHISKSPELPNARIAFEAAQIPMPAKMPPELRRYRNIAYQMAAEGKVMPSWDVYNGILFGSNYTGVDETYLHRLAHAESTYRHNAHNKAGGGKGACGLFQFRVSSTYLEQIYKHSHKFPPAWSYMNGAIGQRTNWRGRVSYVIHPKADAGAIYEACYDPKFSAMLAGFMSLDIKDAIENRVTSLKRPVNHADMYISWFTGINGGPNILDALFDRGKGESPVSNYTGANQRKANPGVFRGDKTLSDYYDFFVNNKGMTDDALEISPRQFSRQITGEGALVFPTTEEVPVPMKRPDPKPVPMGLRR